VTAHLRVDQSPFHRLIGLEMVRAEDGAVELRLPWRDELGRADGSDWFHGGVISALIDIAGDYAIASKLGRGVPTIDLRVDYLRPARRGELRALARAVKVGRTVGVADVELRDANDAVVAVGRCAYSTAERLGAGLASVPDLPGGVANRQDDRCDASPHPGRHRTAPSRDGS
jgi:uncharacterized protein (TIGR00369 family)